MKILLVCNAGMSTSMLVLKMEAAAKKRGLEVDIQALPVTDSLKHLKENDIVMLGPQVRHEIKNLEKIAQGQPPVVLIDMRDYGLMNGEKVLDAALKVING